LCARLYGPRRAKRKTEVILVEEGIGTLIIGKNANWKQEIELGKRTNQNFVSIPHARFIEILSYKAIVREPVRLHLSHPHLSIVAGNILYPASVAEIVTGSDVVVNAIGPRRDGSESPQPRITLLRSLMKSKRPGSSANALPSRTNGHSHRHVAAVAVR
jgi:IS605 OrfB family transposase